MIHGSPCAVQAVSCKPGRSREGEGPPDVDPPVSADRRNTPDGPVTPSFDNLARLIRTSSRSDNQLTSFDVLLARVGTRVYRAIDELSDLWGVGKTFVHSTFGEGVTRVTRRRNADLAPWYRWEATPTPTKCCGRD